MNIWLAILAAWSTLVVLILMFMYGATKGRDRGPCACGCGRIVPVGWDGTHGR